MRLCLFFVLFAYSVLVTLFEFSKQQGGWFSVLQKQVFEEKPFVHWLPCAPGNSAHTPGQPLAKVNPPPPLAAANLLTGELRWGQSSQRVFPGVASVSCLVPSVPALSYCIVWMSATLITGDQSSYKGPHLLWDWKIVSLGYSAKHCLKGKHVISRWRGSKPAANSDGHVLFIAKESRRGEERLWLAALNVSA